MAGETHLFRAIGELLLAGHQGTSPEHAINRLFKKNIRGNENLELDAPELSAENTKVRMELWKKDKIRNIAPREASREPARTDLPVVLLEYRGNMRMLDGGSRCHHWHKNGDTSEHPVFIISVQEK